MMDIASCIEDSGKCCHVFEHSLDELKRALLLSLKKDSRQFRVLRNISFEFERGEFPGECGIFQFEDRYAFG